MPCAIAGGLALAATARLHAILFKYCSTFDSTAAGNIGQVTEALLHELGADFTIACPAFRKRPHHLSRLSVCCRWLAQRIRDGNHPLTPMTDANLVRVLQTQTKAKVGLLRYDTVALGTTAITERIAALRADGVSMAIADAVSDRDLHVLGEACAELKLITGGSGIALGLPENFRRAGLLHAVTEAAHLPKVEGLSAVLAGSASKATNAQVAAWKTSRPALRIDPLALADGVDVVAQALAFADQFYVLREHIGFVRSRLEGST